MLNMRSVGSLSPGTASTSDLGTRAVIRDAAITCMATQGLNVGLRTIAAEAGVSAALIVHHFGSKNGLTEECRRHALAIMEREKARAVSDEAGATILVQLANAEGYAEITAFVMRCLQQGGPAGREFTDDMVAATEAFLKAGVLAGTVHPSRDPHARARLLTAMSVGVLLSWFSQHDGPLDLADFGREMAAQLELAALPALELYTEGLFTTRTPLDAYLAARAGTEPAGEPNPGTTATATE